jgi:hypothetical protein
MRGDMGRGRSGDKGIAAAASALLLMCCFQHLSVSFPPFSRISGRFILECDLLYILLLLRLLLLSLCTASWLSGHVTFFLI